MNINDSKVNDLCKELYIFNANMTCLYLQLIKSDLDGTIGSIENKLDERALLRQKKVLLVIHYRK